MAVPDGFAMDASLMDGERSPEAVSEESDVEVVEETLPLIPAVCSCESTAADPKTQGPEYAPASAPAPGGAVFAPVVDSEDAHE